MFHSKDIDAIKKELNTDYKNGLSAAEAAKRLELNGENVITAKKPDSLFKKFLLQLSDAMVIILIIAAAVSAILTIVEGKNEFVEPAIIIAIVIINAIMGVFQESKAQKALEALQNMSAPNAKVLRDGETVVVPSKSVVAGDVILLEAGDFIPADARLIESFSLKSEESALTGESVASDKFADAMVKTDAAIGDRTNMVFSGCSITYGRAKAVITSTAMGTEMGKIATLLDNEKEQMTPLQAKLAKLGKYLGFICLGVCAIIFVYGMFAPHMFEGENLNFFDKTMRLFMTAVSLAVAAIPEGLPAVVTIVLAMGVSKMAKKNAIIKKLPAVETLGGASVICSDKTGTLTQNKMTVKKVYCFDEDRIYSSEEFEQKRSKELLITALLASDGEVTYDATGKEKHIGDPTETAIVSAAKHLGVEKPILTEKHKRIGEIPFDSDRKLMTTISDINGEIVVITKGAFDVISNRCVDKSLEKAEKANEQMGVSALRVLGVAYKIIDKLPEVIDPDTLERDLTLCGLVGMIDPPREEAKKAVHKCKKAGIKPIMITGDHIITASAIAKELGILNPGDKAITGGELAKMSEEEFDKHIKEYSVYARVSPEDKIKIVKAWQKTGATVSMTGDGVNDAPALKAADIGCAMGITGTDVSKGAADMILTDDNFATIVVAVEQGRGIYDNIKKAVRFLLGCNLGEIFVVFFAMIFGWGNPLLPIQLLWINLITDGMPALALGMEPTEDDVMERKPKKKSESIFAGGMGVRIVLEGFMVGLFTLLGFAFGYYCGSVPNDIQLGQTMAFMVLSMCELFHIFNIRSSKSIFVSKPWKNKYLLGAVAISFVLLLGVVLIPPIAGLFGLVDVDLIHWVFAIICSLGTVIVMEITKLITRLINKSKTKN